MSACTDIEGLLAERASGPLAAEDEAWVVEHLAACPGCREVMAGYEEVFGLVGQAVPTPWPAPLRGEGSPRGAARVLGGDARDLGTPSPARAGEGRGEAPSIATATLRAWKQRRQRRVTALALSAGFGAAAAAAVLVLAPAFMASRAPRGEGAPAEVAALASWEPEVDAVLYDAGEAGDAVEVAAAAADEVTPEDVALAAYDEADTL